MYLFCKLPSNVRILFFVEQYGVDFRKIYRCHFRDEITANVYLDFLVLYEFPDFVIGYRRDFFDDFLSYFFRYPRIREKSLDLLKRYFPHMMNGICSEIVIVESSVLILIMNVVQYVETLLDSWVFLGWSPDDVGLDGFPDERIERCIFQEYMYFLDRCWFHAKSEVAFCLGRYAPIGEDMVDVLERKFLRVKIHEFEYSWANGRVREKDFSHRHDVLRNVDYSECFCHGSCCGKRVLWI